MDNIVKEAAQKPHEQLHEEPSGLMRQSAGVFLTVEHAIYCALGAVLSLAALLAMASAGWALWQAVQQWADSTALLVVMDRLLFVLMLAEILHTVRASIRSGSLTAEPFLIVGLIASIRRVLVITLESSQATPGKAAQADDVFRASMIELGVLGGLILIMVASIYLIRRRSGDEAAR